MTAYVDENMWKCCSAVPLFRHGCQRVFRCLCHAARPSLSAETLVAQGQGAKGVRYAARLRRKPNLKLAQMRMPPLLRTYLMMGGWVSDHAVIDTHMNTLHVFTGLEIRAIPPGRKKLLRAIGG